MQNEMQNLIVRTFVHLDEAQQARVELLAAGLTEDDVKIDVRIDETGPVQGNFAIGDDPDVKGKTAYTHTYAPVAQDDVRDCQVTVHAVDPTLAHQAVTILERFGGFDPDPAAQAAARAALAEQRH